MLREHKETSESHLNQRTAASPRPFAQGAAYQGLSKREGPNRLSSLGSFERRHLRPGSPQMAPKTKQPDFAKESIKSCDYSPAAVAQWLREPMNRGSQSGHRPGLWVPPPVWCVQGADP